MRIRLHLDDDVCVVLNLNEYIRWHGGRPQPCRNRVWRFICGDSMIDARGAFQGQAWRQLMKQFMQAGANSFYCREQRGGN